jgi:hypothetical protein
MNLACFVVRSQFVTLMVRQLCLSNWLFDPLVVRPFLFCIYSHSLDRLLANQPTLTLSSFSPVRTLLQVCDSGGLPVRL